MDYKEYRQNERRCEILQNRNHTTCQVATGLAWQCFMMGAAFTAYGMRIQELGTIVMD